MAREGAHTLSRRLMPVAGVPELAAALCVVCCSAKSGERMGRLRARAQARPRLTGIPARRASRRADSATCTATRAALALTSEVRRSTWASQGGGGAAAWSSEQYSSNGSKTGGGGGGGGATPAETSRRTALALPHTRGCESKR